MVDALGLTIFLIGLALIVIELSMPGYFIGVAGTVCLLLGIVQMAWPDFLLGTPWSPFFAIGVGVAALAASVWFYKRLAPPDSRPATLSSDALVGQEGLVSVEVRPATTKGKVKLGGIVWSAESSEPIPAGSRVVVTRVEGVHVVVKPVSTPANEEPKDV